MKMLRKPRIRDKGAFYHPIEYRNRQKCEIVKPQKYTLVLGSLWTLSFSVIITILLIIRTYLEDKTLKKELKGYAEYSELVRYTSAIIQ